MSSLKTKLRGLFGGFYGRGVGGGERLREDVILPVVHAMGADVWQGDLYRVRQETVQFGTPANWNPVRDGGPLGPFLAPPKGHIWLIVAGGVGHSSSGSVHRLSLRLHESEANSAGHAPLTDSREVSQFEHIPFRTIPILMAPRNVLAVYNPANTLTGGEDALVDLAYLELESGEPVPQPWA